MFGDVHFENLVKDNIGYDPNNRKVKAVLDNRKILITSSSMIFFEEKYIYYWIFDNQSKIVGPIQKVNFRIEKTQMFVFQIYPWNSDELIAIVLKGSRSDYITIVWDLFSNKEVSNHSCKTFTTHINGSNSKAGYILCDDYYINLDIGLPNYFYEWKFVNINSRFIGGYMMNTIEDWIIRSGKLYRKETMIELDTVDDYIGGHFTLNKSNICLERIRFNLDANSAIHYFALDPEMLSLVLDYMEENMIGYLTAILLKNNKGKSPIDITIDNESPKWTELLLK